MPGCQTTLRHPCDRPVINRAATRSAGLRPALRVFASGLCYNDVALIGQAWRESFDFGRAHIQTAQDVETDKLPNRFQRFG